VSEVRRIAQQANRTGGGDVAEAARSIAGEGVGNGLNGPPNSSERGPPEGAGPSDDVGPNGTGSSTVADLGNGNAPDENETGRREGAGPGTDTAAGNAGENGPENAPGSGSERGQNDTGGNATDPGDDGVPSDGSTGNGGDGEGNGPNAAGPENSASTATPTD